MTIEAGFLDDVCAHPDDDFPRRAYSDWLEDNGDLARAEFIRAQLDLASQDGPSPVSLELARRAEALLAAHEADWRRGLPELADVAWGEFRRGFVESATFKSVKAFLRHAPAAFAAAPLRSARFTRAPYQAVRKLAASPWLARLRELNLGNTGMESLTAGRLLGSPHLKDLTTLLLHGNQLGDWGADVVAQGLRGHHVSELYLSGNNISGRGAAALGEALDLPSLRELDLRDNPLGNDGAIDLSSSACWPELRTLYLVNAEIETVGAMALAHALHFPLLSLLFLNHNPIGDEGARALAASPRRANLTQLDLRNCELTDDAGRALAASPHLNHLTLLWLTGNRIRRLDVLAALRQRFGDAVRV